MTYYKLVPARNVWTSKVKRKTKAIKYMFFYWITDQGTGDDVACKIRDLDAYTKTILISAYELEKEVISRLRIRNCIADMVSKPISIHLLKE